MGKSLEEMEAFFQGLVDQGGGIGPQGGAAQALEGGVLHVELEEMPEPETPGGRAGGGPGGDGAKLLP